MPPSARKRPPATQAAGPPCGVLANELEYEPARDGHQRDAEPLAEGHRVSDVACQPVERVVADRVALRLNKRGSQPIVEEARVLKAPHPVLMYEGITLNDVRTKDAEIEEERNEGGGAEGEEMLDALSARAA